MNWPETCFVNQTTFSQILTKEAWIYLSFMVSKTPITTRCGDEMKKIDWKNEGSRLNNEGHGRLFRSSNRTK